MHSRLFSELGEVGERIAVCPRVLLVTDFDGTLCAFTSHPEETQLASGTREALAELAASDRVTVGVLSGRSRADLQARVGLPGLYYGGNHGLEISGPGEVFVEPSAAAQVNLLQDLSQTLTDKLTAAPGAFVEDKGLTLSVHYRLVDAAQEEEVRRIVHAVMAASSHPFQLVAGNKVFEVRPRVAWNKGSAVGWIKERLGRPAPLVIYLGDDATDEDAFEACMDGVTIRVGPPDGSSAKYHLADPGEVLIFLEWLTDQLRVDKPSIAT